MASLERRMMYLCERVYRLGHELVPWPKPSHWDSETKLDSIKKSGIDEAAIGQIPEGVVVVFRGTLPPDWRKNLDEGWRTLLDWLNNARLEDGAADIYAGKVHGGFAKATNELFGPDGVEAAISAKLAQPGAPQKIFLAGHSKGGPLAQLTAWRLRQNQAFDGIPIHVVTFASARAGNAAFVQDFATRNIASLGYVIRRDIVPNLPPSGSVTAGWAGAVLRRLKLADADGIFGFVAIEPIVRDAEEPLGLMQRVGRFFRMIWGALNGSGIGPIGDVINAHMVYEGTRYDRLVP